MKNMLSITEDGRVIREDYKGLHGAILRTLFVHDGEINLLGLVDEVVRRYPEFKYIPIYRISTVITELMKDGFIRSTYVNEW